MSRHKPSSPRRLGDPRGTILVICLLLMVVAAFLTGLVLLLARNEGTMAATSKGSLQAINAAEYGIELAVNSLNPAKTPSTIQTQCLNPVDAVTCDTVSRPIRRVWVTAGLRDGSNNSAQPLGAAACPAGYSTSLGCTGFTFAATGWASAWLSTQASTQIERSLSIYRGCNITEYSC